MTEPLLAEPDKIDFNTMANDPLGRGRGLLRSPAGGPTDHGGQPASPWSTASSSMSTPTPTLTARPDRVTASTSIVVDDAGVIVVHHRARTRPTLFPRPAHQRRRCWRRCTASRGRCSLTDYVIDKRKFLAPSLLTKVDPTADLIRNFTHPGARCPPIQRMVPGLR